MQNHEPGGFVATMEENLKKAVTELLLLSLLREREYYIGELAERVREKSGGALSIVFPYAAIYRLLDENAIEEVKKRIAPDGRKRQYYRITEAGLLRCAQLRQTYDRFLAGVELILKEDERHEP